MKKIFIVSVLLMFVFSSYAQASESSLLEQLLAEWDFDGTAMDGYSGQYIDGNTHVILLVKGDTDTREKLESVMTDLERKTVLFRNVNYSYAELQKTYQEIEDYYSSDSNAFIISISLNIIENQIDVGIRKEKYSEWLTSPENTYGDIVHAFPMEEISTLVKTYDDLTFKEKLVVTKQRIHLIFQEPLTYVVLVIIADSIISFVLVRKKTQAVMSTSFIEKKHSEYYSG